MRLSKNFAQQEFTTSAGIKIDPTSEQLFCLKTLCQNILQPIRDKYGPVNITSGLRNSESTEKLIAAGVSASRTSDHMAWCQGNPKGTGAADFICRGKNMGVIFSWIQRHLMHNVGQVIYYPYRDFIHVSNRFSKIFCMPDPRPESWRKLLYENGGFLRQ